MYILPSGFPCIQFRRFPRKSRSSSTISKTIAMDIPRKRESTPPMPLKRDEPWKEKVKEKR